MNRIVVLGCGAVGRYMAIDLCKTPGYEVVAVDVNSDVLEGLAAEYPIEIRVADLSVPGEIAKAVTDADIVVGSVPGFIGYKMAETVIRAGKNIVDISYFCEDPFSLDELAREHEVTAVVDCGVAPGMANIILGDHVRTMKVARYECYVGGIPKTKNAPLGYKSPFPVIEVLEEYAESSRMVIDGKIVTKPMLSDIETIDIDGIGLLACLNSDGLRTLIETMDIPFMLEKTLRYPGHTDAMRVLKDTGFLNLTPINAGGTSVRPIDVTSSLLSQVWKYAPDEADLTVMRLVISGDENGEPVTYTYDMCDEYDSTTGTPSMARTTGYTCAAVARLVLNGEYTRIGISPPEYVGREKGCRERVIRYLADRDVRLRVSSC